jgi:hypothetical protein
MDCREMVENPRNLAIKLVLHSVHRVEDKGQK